jgi:hypothetical protein
MDNRKITNYIIVKAITSEHLAEFVKDWLVDGWELYGSPFHSGELFCQAVVLYF